MLQRLVRPVTGLLFAFLAGPIAAFAQPIAGTGDEQGMTLLDLIQSGGVIMILLGVLAVLATALILFFLITLRVGRLVNADFTQKLYGQLAQGDLDGSAALCDRNRSLTAAVVMEGMRVEAGGRDAVHDAMQAEGSRRSAVLWQRVTYLQDIAVLAPMLGILGTVLGMIRSFNAIAFEFSRVKPIEMAAGVSQALVTTAAGLAVAIPTMAAYFLFRGRVQRIISAMEASASELLDCLVKAKTRR